MSLQVMLKAAPTTYWEMISRCGGRGVEAPGVKALLEEFFAGVLVAVKFGGVEGGGSDQELVFGLGKMNSFGRGKQSAEKILICERICKEERLHVEYHRGYIYINMEFCGKLREMNVLKLLIINRV